MRNECNIIRDILPLYAEHMVSPDTASFVEEHLQTCAACQRESAQMQQPQALPASADAAPLLSLRKKLERKRIQAIILTAVLVMALLVSAFAAVDAPIYFPYTEDLITAEPVDNGGIRLTFSEAVTDFDYTIFPDPDGASRYICSVEAWTSLWDRWFSSDKGALSTIVYPTEPDSTTVLYAPNDGTESVCVYGETDSRGTIALPRLVLGYYLLLAVLVLALLSLLWVLVRKKAAVRLWTERVLLYPVSYILSHLILMGFRFPSYSMPRDFLLIVFVSLLLYCGFLLLHSIRRLKKEIQEINDAAKRT